jgi:diguanylate cyclase (GGDEF)-like protein
MLDVGSATGLAVIDFNGNVVLANRLLLEFGGFDPAGPQLSIADCVIPIERDNVQSEFEKARAGETVRFETVVGQAGGKSTVVGVTLYPLYRGTRFVAVGARVHDRAQLLDAEQHRLENRQSIRLRQLYFVAASAGRTPAQQIEALLVLGNEMFGTDLGYVTEFEGDEMIARFVAGGGVRHGVGYRRKVFETFTQHMLGTDQVLAVDDLDNSPWRDHPARRTLAWTSMICTPVNRFSTVFGSMGFASIKPGGRHFSEDDKDLMRLMSALCGSALERLAHEERLGALAFYDALTGLPNRVLFDDRVEQTLIAARRHHQRFSLMFFDLDDFKDVNDRHGHAAGDELLRVVAHRLLAVARESDTVARHGGDEFVALQRFVRSPQDAMRLARRINETLRQPIMVDALVLTISASIGVAIYPDHGTTARELLANADAALYRAKGAGRDRAVLFKELVGAAT